MRVLRILGDTQLLHAELCNDLAKGQINGFGRKRDVDVRHCGVVLRHADIIKREESAAYKAVEVLVHKRAGDLSRARSGRKL